MNWKTLLSEQSKRLSEQSTRVPSVTPVGPPPPIPDPPNRKPPVRLLGLPRYILDNKTNVWTWHIDTSIQDTAVTISGHRDHETATAAHADMMKVAGVLNINIFDATGRDAQLLDCPKERNFSLKGTEDGR